MSSRGIDADSRHISLFVPTVLEADRSKPFHQPSLLKRQENAIHNPPPAYIVDEPIENTIVEEGSVTMHPVVCGIKYTERKDKMVVTINHNTPRTLRPGLHNYQYDTEYFPADSLFILTPDNQELNPGVDLLIGPCSVSDTGVGGTRKNIKEEVASACDLIQPYARTAGFIPRIYRVDRYPEIVISKYQPAEATEDTIQYSRIAEKPYYFIENPRKMVDRVLEEKGIMPKLKAVEALAREEKEYLSPIGSTEEFSTTWYEDIVRRIEQSAGDSTHAVGARKRLLDSARQALYELTKDPSFQVDDGKSLTEKLDHLNPNLLETVHNAQICDQARRILIDIVSNYSNLAIYKYGLSESGNPSFEAVKAKIQEYFAKRGRMAGLKSPEEMREILQAAIDGYLSVDETTVEKTIDIHDRTKQMVNSMLDGIVGKISVYESSISVN